MPEATVLGTKSLADITRPRAVVLDGLRPAAGATKVGRTRVKPLRRAMRVNWFSPPLWAIITEVATLPNHRKSMSPTAILRDLQHRSHVFKTLTTQVLGTFFHAREDGQRDFTARALKLATDNANFIKGPVLRRGILVSDIFYIQLRTISY